MAPFSGLAEQGRRASRPAAGVPARLARRLDRGGVPPQTRDVPELVLYDGGCGLCHRSVLFLLRRDTDGTLFRFAPLGGEAFAREVPEEARAGLPDSIVLVSAEGRLLVRSEAALHALGRLGRGWRAASRLLRLVPGPLRDAAYDLVARFRLRLFPRPESACPRLPPELARRFLP